MTISAYHLLIFICCGLVTVIPKVLPFLLVKRVTLPQVMIRWLSYIPICILTALIAENIFKSNGEVMQFNKLNLLIVIPTLLIAYLTKSLAITVLLGVLMMAGVRFWLG